MPDEVSTSLSSPRARSNDGAISGFVSTAEYLTLPCADQTWVVEDLIPTGKTRKSYLALQIAAAVSTGARYLLGFPILTHGPVAYLQLDTPRALWKARLEEVTELGLDVTQMKHADRELAPYPYDILRPDHASWLHHYLLPISPVLTIFDVTRELHRGNEDSSEQMQKVVSALVEAVSPSALLLVSHTRKPTIDASGHTHENLIADARGSSYIPGRMDCIIKATRKMLIYKGRTADERRLRVHFPTKRLWALHVDEEVSNAVKSVLRDNTLGSMLQRAEALGQRIGRSTEASRSILRRHLEETGGEVS